MSTSPGSTILDYQSASIDALTVLINPTRFYRLQSLTSSTGGRENPVGMVIDLHDPTGLAGINNPDKGRKVIQWSSHGSLLFGSDGHNQEWWFIPSGQRNNKPVYKIFNNGFLNFLTDNNSGAPICKNSNGSDNQLWELIPSAFDQCFTIRNFLTQRVLEVPGNNTEGSQLLMSAMSATGNNSNQFFRFLAQPPQVFNHDIRSDTWARLSPSYATDKAMDLSAGSAANGTNIQLWQYMPGNYNQQWQIQKEDRFFTIRSRSPGKAAEISAFSLSNAGNVVSWDYWGGKNQQYIVIEAAREDGKFILFNINSGKCIEAAGWGRENGTNVQQWDFLNGSNQKWEIRVAR